MIQLFKMCNMRPGRVLADATVYFGPGGLNLERVRSSPTSLAFEGGGGFVSVEAFPAEIEEPRSRVEITAREWENQARAFMEHLDGEEEDPGDNDTTTP